MSVRHFMGIGHSHIHGFTFAGRKHASVEANKACYTPVCFLDKPFQWPVTTQGTEQVPNPAWVEALQQHLDSPGAVVFMCVQGSEWWQWSLTPGPRPFDFIDPFVDDNAPLIGELIPYDIFMAKARATFSFIGFAAGVVRSVRSVPLAQFAPPPPVRDLAPLVATRPELTKVVQDHGIAPASFRLKVWRACSRAMADVCAEHGVDFMPAPPEGIDPDGYLAPEFISDAVHGNHDWGLLQFQRVLAWSEHAREIT
jgi:hypothetical protein